MVDSVEDQADDYIQQSQTYTAEQLVKYAKDNRKVVKAVKNDVIIETKPKVTAQISDLSLANKGPREDDIFAGSNLLRVNVRRGNSVIEILRSDLKVEKAIFARRGLQKFFDMYIEYFDLGPEYQSHITHNKHHGKMKKIILNPVYDSLKNNNKIHIYKLGKANGENAQVAFVQELDCWAIASKNVCLLANKLEDVEKYTDGRYAFAQLIGKTWFQIYNKLDTEKQNKLKKELAGRTMVGEYCGNPDYQHLVRYSEINLHFYAIVDNDSYLSCIPPDQAYAIFNEFGLTICANQKYTVSNRAEFDAKCIEIFTQVAQAKLEDEGEGNVLYFVQENEKGQQTTLTLCKTKTLEYRILRKLREKLKNCITLERDTDKFYQKFVDEVKELCAYTVPTKPMDYFYSIAQAAFDYIKNKASKSDVDIIAARYISFLDLIKTSVETKTKVSSESLQKLLSNIPLHPEELEQYSNTKLCRIVIITTPFYFSNEETEKLAEHFQMKRIDNTWSAKLAINNFNTVNILHQVPRFDEKELKNIVGNTAFLFLVPTEKEKDECLLKLSSKETKEYYKANHNKLVHLQQFFKSSNVEKQVDRLSEEINAFIEKLNGAGFTFYEKIEGFLSNNNNKRLEQTIEKLEDKFQSLRDLDDTLNVLSLQKKVSSVKFQEHQLLVFIPSAIPSTGKSTLFNSFVEHYQQNNNNNNDFSVRIIQSDVIRGQIMDERRAIEKDNKNQKKSLLERTQPQYKKKYDETLQKLIKDTVKLPQLKHVLFVDKNHPPNGLEAATKLILSFAAQVKNLDVRFVLIVPKCQTPLRLSKFEYPYSFTYLLNCLDRVFKRETHETLEGDPVHLASIVVMFFNMYRHFRFNGSQYLSKYSIDDYLEVKYHEEKADSDSKISPNLKKALEQILSAKAPHEMPDSTLITEFIERLYKEYPEILPIDQAEQNKAFSEQVLQKLSEYGQIKTEERVKEKEEQKLEE